MKKFLTAILFMVLSVSSYAQKLPPRPPAPPHPSKAQAINLKSKELDKKYATEKKLIMNHPILPASVKKSQLKALTERYKQEKRMLK